MLTIVARKLSIACLSRRSLNSPLITRSIEKPPPTAHAHFRSFTTSAPALPTPSPETGLCPYKGAGRQ